MQRRILSVLLVVAGCSNQQASPSGGDASVPEPTTIVSLTFDDTRADQFQVGEIVAARQMRATFYVNSPRVGRDGYMTYEQLRQLQDAGNEIGGHTLAHLHLSELDSNAAQREMCDDRAALLAHGLDIATLAYPFGDASPAIRRIAQQCGYSAARALGGIAAGSNCPTCPHVSPLAPPDPFQISAVSQITPATTVADLQKLVLDAEAGGGGWLPIVFHHVCDNCATNAVSPATLTAFLDWLAARRATGTEVRTVREVLAASVKPSVAGPLPGLNSNLIKNASFELGSEDAATPDCWSQRTVGMNTGSVMVTPDAIDGHTAQLLTVTGFTDGSRRLGTRVECALPVQAGRSYRVSAWYKADVAPLFVISYLTGAGTWKTLEQSPPLPASPVYVQGVYATSPLPPDAAGLSVGLGIAAAGSLTMDAFETVDAAAQLDNAPPVVVVSGPAEGSTVAGSVDITASAADADGIERVDFRIDDRLVEFADREPFTLHWNVEDVHAGPHVITARAFDRTGKVMTSVPLTVMVGR